MSPKISKELANHRLEQAKEDLLASKTLYEAKLCKMGRFSFQQKFEY